MLFVPVLSFTSKLQQSCAIRLWLAPNHMKSPTITPSHFLSLPVIFQPHLTAKSPLFPAVHAFCPAAAAEVQETLSYHLGLQNCSLDYCCYKCVAQTHHMFVIVETLFCSYPYTCVLGGRLLKASFWKSQRRIKNVHVLENIPQIYADDVQTCTWT